MTTDAERECYYRLAKAAAPSGAVVELGAWMGASTAYIAAGVRDSGAPTKAHVYDQFISKAGHIGKVKAFYDKQGIDAVPVGPSLEAFKANLGPLLSYVEPHQGKIEAMRWTGGPISLLVTDAPKRVPAISSVLTKLRDALQPGAVMAWQDFCHFPSYEIAACLYRLRDHFEFREAVYPGSTLVFTVKSVWDRQEVAMSRLDIGTWTPAEIAEAWDYWLDRVDERKADIFRCGRAMFLCDIGEPEIAVEALAEIIQRRDKAVVKKWAYLRERRADFVTRYAPLFAYLEGQGAL
jgi:hypothetical protein